MSILNKSLTKNFAQLGREAGKMNSTRALEEHFSILMAETDPNKLASDAIELVESSGGISEMNLRKFKKIVNEKLKGRNPLIDLQFYISNYVLAGEGMSVNRMTRHT